MIRVVMLGRTGNNLFQYALGRVLSRKHNVPLIMDGSWFNSYHWKSASCLHKLPLKMSLQRRWSFGSRLMKRLINKHPWELARVPVLREADGMVSFDDNFLKGPSDCVLMGYFQSWMYFKEIEDELRKDLQMDQLTWGDETKIKASQMCNQKSVAVHIRRTDYLGSGVFDVCDYNYYIRSMNRLRERHENLRFYIFSDDPEWCRRSFADIDTEVCSLPDSANDPLHDLYLMSCAHHHIIANSSYSWWSAWIANHSEQNVLAPDRWFRGDKTPPISQKLYPGWETVPTENGSN